MDSWIENEFRLEQLLPLIKEQLEAGKSVRFKPWGISMLPMLRQGIDSVVLSPVPAKLRKYDLPLYLRDDGHYVLHRIVKVGICYSCIGDNQFTLENGLRRDQMIAVVTAFYRRNRKVSVKDLRYWFYCRVWHYSRPLRRFWRRGIGWIKRKIGFNK